MPPPLSPQELRLSRFCRAFAAIYLFGAAVFAALPGLTYRAASLGGDAALSDETRLWNVLAVSMMVACGATCAVVAPRPRERRFALLPVILTKLSAGVAALANLPLVHGAGHTALVSVAVADLAVFVLTLAVYRSASPGVRLDVAAQPPPADAAEKAAPVQLGVPKP